MAVKNLVPKYYNYEGEIKLLKRKITYLLIMSLICCLVSLGGCGEKKPAPAPKPVKLAPEVEKYQVEEPSITLYRTSTGAKEEVELEEYLQGVVAAEINDEFPEEALKAQAIVARTSTLALIEYENGTKGKHNTDASDDHTEFQAYDPEKITDNISKAVEATRGQVLTTNQGKFVHALFHSVSGNKTASIEEGFPALAKKAPYIVPVDTDGIKNAPEKYRKWTVKVPKAEVKKIMGDKAGSLDDIKIAKKGPSERVLKITAGKASITGVKLREEIGFDRLFSTNIKSIKPEGNYIVFQGVGWGHGCGMEQWGAFTMAKENDSTAKQIVEHYYPQAKLTQLYK